MSAMSKEEYLKRYLSTQDETKAKSKKKRKKKMSNTLQNGRGMKIFDDDAVWENNHDVDDADNLLLTAEEKPQIAEVDHRTPAEKQVDKYRKSAKWKTLGLEDPVTDGGGRDAAASSDVDIPRRARARQDSDSDMELPRKSKPRHDSDSDMDVPGASTQRSDSDMDVPRAARRRRDSESDLEVPRTSKHRLDSDSDLEVPRKSASERRTPGARRANSPAEARRGKTRHNAGDSDVTMPVSSHRRSKDMKSDARSKKDDSRRFSKSRRHDSDSSSDAPRSDRPTATGKDGRGAVARRNESDSDMDVPRTGARHDSDSDGASAKLQKTKMMSGGRGGLTSVGSLRKEIQEAKNKDTDLSVLADQYKEQKTVFRDRSSGKRRNVDKEKEEDDEKRRAKEEQYDRWGKGLQQSKMRDAAIADALHESNKPLARYADDEDLEKMRREEMRDGDPMAAYIMRRKQKQQPSASGLPKYRGPPPPPNRYALQPGYRWDGVDRSNGFEKKYFESMSNEQANRDDFYKWSVGDM